MATATACGLWTPSKQVKSQAAIQRVYWGLAQDGASADVTSMVTCPNGFPCDIFANSASYNDSKPDMNKRLTAIWTCQPQRLVLSDVVIASLKLRMACIGGAPIVPRTIGILQATWGGASAGNTVDVTQQVREICGANAVRCQVPAMAYIFGMPDRGPKTLRIRFTCNNEETPGQFATENSVVDLRCERNTDLNHD
ncbi:hypothetical protein BH11PSE3_BH11PSE3_08250 [soil metagenome]